MKWQLKETSESSDIETLKKFCSKILKSIKGDEVFLLDGPMASGKSEFVKQLVSIYLGHEFSSSPSYALNHEYGTEMLKVEHWDLFRLESEDELESTGFWDRLQSSKVLTFIEWSSHLNQEWLPKARKYFLLKFTVENGKFKIELNQAT